MTQEEILNQNKKLKMKIYQDCMTQPLKSCVEEQCPLYDFVDSCHRQFKRGEFTVIDLKENNYETK